jgi:hypothetical protein
MSAETAALTRSWCAGAYTVTLTVPKPRPGQVAHCSIEWSPTVPDKLDAAARAEYVAGRNRALADWAHEMGIRVAVVDP